tara:strand:- start:235 stop:381 length:147 start_codon:yes stop_codon:yes gene_type:complete
MLPKIIPANTGHKVSLHVGIPVKTENKPSVAVWNYKQKNRKSYGSNEL